MCNYRIHAESARLVAQHAEECSRSLKAMREDCDRSLHAMQDRCEEVLSLVAGAVPRGVLTKPSVWLTFGGCDDRPAFRVKDYVFSFRACPLHKNLDSAFRCQMYGGVIVHHPTVTAAPKVFSARFYVALFKCGHQEGSGSAMGVYTGTRESALAITFAIPVRCTPPWSVYVAVMSLVDNAPADSELAVRRLARFSGDP
ncbi:MAG: hypothetical protein M0R22_10575 [Dehalococcoidia bacterium]|nr:hypothetical protein [Dehalococcoidia bacterium]